jgi:tRNA(adenine34) deaminase
MCAGAAYAARISRLVFAAADPKAGFAGTLYDLPGDHRLNHTFQTEQGILEAEAAELLREFFKERRKKL